MKLKSCSLNELVEQTQNKMLIGLECDRLGKPELLEDASIGATKLSLDLGYVFREAFSISLPGLIALYRRRTDIVLYLMSNHYTVLCDKLMFIPELENIECFILQLCGYSKHYKEIPENILEACCPPPEYPKLSIIFGRVASLFRMRY